MSAHPSVCENSLLSLNVLRQCSSVVDQEAHESRHTEPSFVVIAAAGRASNGAARRKTSMPEEGEGW